MILLASCCLALPIVSLITIHSYAIRSYPLTIHADQNLNLRFSRPCAQSENRLMGGKFNTRICNSYGSMMTLERTRLYHSVFMNDQIVFSIKNLVLYDLEAQESL